MTLRRSLTSGPARSAARTDPLGYRHAPAPHTVAAQDDPSPEAWSATRPAQSVEGHRLRAALISVSGLAHRSAPGPVTRAVRRSPADASFVPIRDTEDGRTRSPQHTWWSLFLRPRGPRDAPTIETSDPQEACTTKYRFTSRSGPQGARPVGAGSRPRGGPRHGQRRFRRYGANTEYLRGLVDHWLNGYDWRARRPSKRSDRFRNRGLTVPAALVHGGARGPIRSRSSSLTAGRGSWDYDELIRPSPIPPASAVSRRQLRRRRRVHARVRLLVAAPSDRDERLARRRSEPTR